MSLVLQSSLLLESYLTLVVERTRTWIRGDLGSNSTLGIFGTLTSLSLRFTYTMELLNIS